ERNEIGSGKQVVELIYQFYLQAACTCRGEIRVVSNHPHTETDCAATQFAANAAHADYAQSLVVQFDAFKILFVPSLSANVCVSLWNLAREGEQQGESVFGSRNRISAGRVQYDDATTGRCLDIHVIHSNAGPAYHTQFLTCIQNFGGDLGLAAHHQRAERRNQVDEFALVQARFNRDLQRVLAREFVHSTLRNGIGDEDLRRSHSSLTFKRSIRSHKRSF